MRISGVLDDGLVKSPLQAFGFRTNRQAMERT
jgi:hypothetical protein